MSVAGRFRFRGLTAGLAVVDGVILAPDASGIAVSGVSAKVSMDGDVVGTAGEGAVGAFSWVTITVGIGVWLWFLDRVSSERSRLSSRGRGCILWASGDRGRVVGMDIGVPRDAPGMDIGIPVARRDPAGFARCS